MMYLNLLIKMCGSAPGQLAYMQSTDIRVKGLMADPIKQKENLRIGY